MVSSMQRMGVRAPFLIIGGIIVTMMLEPVLTMVLVATLPFIALLIWLVSRKGIPLYAMSQAAVDTMVRVVRENASGIRVIKALCKTDYEKRRFAAANDLVTERERQAGIVMGITNPAMTLILNLGCVAVIIVGAYRVNGGRTQPGEILAFLTYFAIILNATITITRIFTIYSKGSASSARIAKVLAQPEDLPLYAPNHVESGYHIIFENVGFSYNSQTSTLKDISFAVRRGETLGILGETGSGKSTIIQLLLRVYDIDAGVIRVNGDDIRGIPPERFYAMFGTAFQNDALFAQTITENIDFGRNLNAGQIRAASEFAQARNFVDSLRGGFSYRLAPKGANLSGGQRQRLLISRALASRPEILILDDSSSALDYQTDANFRAALRENFRGTTAIIVAQRISSIMDADRILVLEKGRVAAYGTHEELRSSRSIYQEILRSQTRRSDTGASTCPA
jgi:ATP-binding cassette subfamily B protein